MSGVGESILFSVSRRVHLRKGKETETSVYLIHMHNTYSTSDVSEHAHSNLEKLHITPACKERTMAEVSCMRMDFSTRGAWLLMALVSILTHNNSYNTVAHPVQTNDCGQVQEEYSKPHPLFPRRHLSSPPPTLTSFSGVRHP